MILSALVLTLMIVPVAPDVFPTKVSPIAKFDIPAPLTDAG